MNVMLDMAISLNGMISRKDGQEDWLPYDGWVEFLEQAQRYGNIVMGRESYERVTELYKDHNFDDVEVEHKLIISRRDDFHPPDAYMVVESPIAALQYLQEKGIETLYLIGGGVINAEFMKQKLITHIHVTVTPYILGSGRPFMADGDYEQQLTLRESRNLSNGRVRLMYEVNK